MSSRDYVDHTISKVLTEQVKNGETTRGVVTNLVLSRMKSGGDYPRGFVETSVRDGVSARVARQLKRPIGGKGAAVLVRINNMPAEIKEVLGTLPGWLAIEEGKSARHIYYLVATPAHWSANGELKEKKGRQNFRAANKPQEMAKYLTMLGVNSLSELIRS